jgi:uracil-DNA glycosylase
LALASNEFLREAGSITDAPKLLGSPDACTARRRQLSEPHVAPLSAFVASLRNECGPYLTIPDFDPWDGGVGAEILYLLEAPGGRAIGSGFVSRNNPDETAKNFFELNQAAGIPRQRTVTWNIVPWYVGTGKRIRPVVRTDIEAALPFFRQLLDLLPRLRAAVLIGRKAERAADVLAETRPEIRVFRSPHPSPLFVNRSPGNRGRILRVLGEVRVYVGIGEAAG